MVQVAFGDTALEIQFVLALDLASGVYANSDSR